jgi:hypothetical protein
MIKENPDQEGEGPPSNEDMATSSDDEESKENNNAKFSTLLIQHRNHIEGSNAFTKLRNDFRHFVMFEDSSKRNDESTFDPNLTAEPESNASEENPSFDENQQILTETSQEISSSFIATLGGLWLAPLLSLASYRGEKPLHSGKKRVKWTCVSSPVFSKRS